MRENIRQARAESGQAQMEHFHEQSGTFSRAGGTSLDTTGTLAVVQILEGTGGAGSGTSRT